MALITEAREGLNNCGLFKTNSIFSIIGFSILLLFVRWILRGFYRLYFHPLSSFPGPRFSAFTRLPQIVAIWTGDVHKYVACLHENYGEVVRIAPDELSFLHHQAWRDICGHGSREGKGSAPPKDFGRRARPLNGAISLILLPDNVQHARTRKIFSPAFADRALIQQAPLFTRYADQLVQCLRNGISEGNKFDMVRMYNFTTFDVMGDLTFGESLHMLDEGKYDPWVSNIFSSIKRTVQFNVIHNFYPIVGKAIHLLFDKYILKKSYEHFEHSVTRVTKRLEKGRATEGVDLWDLVLQQQEKHEVALTRPEMDANSGMFMIAGTETTATVLSGVTYLLLSNPEKMDTLVKEIRSAFNTSDDISMEATQALPYLNACLKEALRMYPPLPIGLPHRTPRDGSTICGYYVPPDFVVAAHHFVVYQSPTLWTDPTKYAPERWMGDEKYANDSYTAFQPFSLGPRDCIGKNMAYHEMRLLLTKVLYNFDLTLCPESKGWRERQKVYGFWEKLPLMVEVKERAA